LATLWSTFLTPSQSLQNRICVRLNMEELDLLSILQTDFEKFDPSPYFTIFRELKNLGAISLTFPDLEGSYDGLQLLESKWCQLLKNCANHAFVCVSLGSRNQHFNPRQVNSPYKSAFNPPYKEAFI